MDSKLLKRRMEIICLKIINSKIEKSKLVDQLVVSMMKKMPVYLRKKKQTNCFDSPSRIGGQTIPWSNAEMEAPVCSAIVQNFFICVAETIMSKTFWF